MEANRQIKYYYTPWDTKTEKTQNRAARPKEKRVVRECVVANYARTYGYTGIDTRERERERENREKNKWKQKDPTSDREMR